MYKKCGKQSVKFAEPVTVKAAASVVGPKEGEGPLAAHFDRIAEDQFFGEETWEKAESKFLKNTMELAMSKAGVKKDDIDCVLSGDLLSQSIGSTFGVRDFGLPFFGIFGACSTFGEGMTLGAMMIDGGFAQNVLFGASSHFCAAERLFRFPLELGAQTTPTSSRTVTGAGAGVLVKAGGGPYVTYATTGRIVDLGVKDANNMGAAMAPAAADTLSAHFADTGRKPEFYDVIATGDLGYVGRDILLGLMREEGCDLAGLTGYTDCGIEIYDKESQDTKNGGSGCGCSAAAFSGYFFNKLKNKEIRNILLVPTGALLSTVSAQQGESIPCVAHAVAIENEWGR